MSAGEAHYFSLAQRSAVGTEFYSAVVSLLLEVHDGVKRERVPIRFDTFPDGNRERAVRRQGFGSPHWCNVGKSMNKLGQSSQVNDSPRAPRSLSWLPCPFAQRCGQKIQRTPSSVPALSQRACVASWENKGGYPSPPNSKVPLPEQFLRDDDGSVALSLLSWRKGTICEGFRRQNTPKCGEKKKCAQVLFAIVVGLTMSWRGGRRGRACGRLWDGSEPAGSGK